MIERLAFDEASGYNEVEASIHIARYSVAAEFCRGKRILDIACGEGYGSWLMRKWGGTEVVGVDVSEKAINSAKANFEGDGILFFQGAAESLTFLDNTFDLIVSLETMEHIPDVRKYLEELKRVLKTDGMIILSCPNDWWYYPTENEKNPFHLKKYTLEEFLDLTGCYFGTPSYLLEGHRADGFVNICHNNIHVGSNQRSMVEMDTLMVNLLPAKEELLSKQACYWVAIWNYGEPIICETSAAVYPLIYNPRGTAVEIELRAMLADANRQIEEWRKTCAGIEADAQRVWNECVKMQKTLEEKLREKEDEIAELKDKRGWLRRWSK